MKRALLAMIVAACSSGSATGTEGGACYANDTCNAGLTCLSHLCVNAAPDATVDSAAADALTDSPSDASPLDASLDHVQPLSPTDFTGLSLWLVSDEGVVTDAGYFSKWIDQSPAHNNATPIEQPPTLVPSVFGTKPGVNLNGAPMGCGGLNANAQPVLIEFVATNIAGDFFSMGNLPPALTLGEMNGNAAASITGTSPIAITTNQSITTGAHLVGAELDGFGNLTVRVDGSLIATASTDAGTEPNFGVSATYISSATVGEIVVVIGAVTPSQVAGLEAYLLMKYSL